MRCLLKWRWNAYMALQAKRFGKKVYWLTLLCVQKWKIFVSTKLTFSSFTTNLALALKVLFYKEKLESWKVTKFFASGNKDTLHESLQQRITKGISTRKMRIFNFIFEFTYLKRELIRRIIFTFGASPVDAACQRIFFNFSACARAMIVDHV